ncbi:MAG: N-acetylneuraminate synthase [Actinomycetia bacterium]|nr:N-acetylneuraminate synthase [Actinomycetes bacterium]
MDLDGRSIGAGSSCFVIAEVGVNHNGDVHLAHDLVDAAADTGADAVKFQTFRALDLVAPGAPTATYQRTGRSGQDRQLELLAGLELPIDALQALRDRCRSRGITFLSTPFDPSSADLLDELDVPAFKVSSGELTNLPFLADLAGRGRPMLVSTGMADLADVAAAVDVIRGAGNDDLVLLQCVSCYPAPAAAANLRAMASMREAFGVEIGYSDHTLGATVAIAAVALGASVLEKHLTLDRTQPGPDHRSSLEPAELTSLIVAVRDVEAALGDGVKQPAPCEAETAAVARKSLVTTRDLPAGHPLADDDLAARRPGTGFAPDRRDDLLGRRLARDVGVGTVLGPDDLR